MKEYYTSFITSALCAIPVALAEHISLSHPISAFIIPSIAFFIRGTILLLPIPLLRDVRISFHNAHPEAVGMERSDKEKIFRAWKKKK